MDSSIVEALSVGEQILDKFKEALDYFSKNIADIIWVLIQLVLLIVAAKLIIRLTSFITSNVIKKARTTQGGRKRVESRMTLLRSFMRYFITVVAIIAGLYIVGWGPALTAAVGTVGIGAIVIGFGAQSLVADVVAGLFLMFENQFDVGDYITIDDVSGTVTATALRVTYIKSWKGDQIIVPNGSIKRVINLTRGGYVAVVDIKTPYEYDTATAMRIIYAAAQKYAKEHSELVEEGPQMQGITELGESSVNVRITCKAKQMMHWQVERGMHLQIKEALESAGIKFPYPRMVIIDEANGEVESATDITAAMPDEYSPVWQREQLNLQGGPNDDD